MLGEGCEHHAVGRFQDPRDRQYVVSCRRWRISNVEVENGELVSCCSGRDFLKD